MLPPDDYAPSSRRMTAHEVDAVIQRAIPLYIAELSSLPYYAERKANLQFWYSYVGSRIVEAHRLVLEHDQAAAAAERQSDDGEPPTAGGSHLLPTG